MSGSAAPAGADGLPYPRRGWAILTLGLGLAMVVLTGNLANLALPRIGQDFAVSPSQAIWVATAYQLAVTMALLPAASLGEIVGYRRVYLWGMVLFTAAAGACALADSLPQLVAARMLQGLGGAGVMSVNTALIRFVYPAARLGRGMGYNALIGSSTMALGPSIAAGILAVADWHALFALNLPLGIAAWMIGRRVLPANPLAEQRFDLASAGLNAAFFFLLILALDRVGHGLAGPAVAGLFAAALAVGTALVWRQLSQPRPLLPIDLLARPVFALSVMAAVFSFCAQSMAFTALPFFLIETLGKTQTETGLLLTPWSVAMAAIVTLAGPLADRRSPAVIGGIGQAMLCSGLVALALLPAEPAWWRIILPAIVCGAGFGLFNTPNNRTIMASAPRSRSGGASGMQATARLLGQTIGAALVALLFNLFPAAPGSFSGTPLVLAVAAGFCVVAAAASLARPRG